MTQERPSADLDQMGRDDAICALVNDPRFQEAMTKTVHGHCGEVSDLNVAAQRLAALGTSNGPEAQELRDSVKQKVASLSAEITGALPPDLVSEAKRLHPTPDEIGHFIRPSSPGLVALSECMGVRKK